MTVQDIIKTSLRKLAVVASGETVPPAELYDGLDALQTMLRSWSGKKLNSYATVEELVVLTSSQATYTWGLSTSDIITTRPYEIVNAYLEEAITDYERIKTAILNAGGTGYHVGDILTITQSGASGGTLRVLTLNTTAVATFEIVTKGTGYFIANGLATTVAPSGGTGAKINITAIEEDKRNYKMLRPVSSNQYDALAVNLTEDEPDRYCYFPNYPEASLYFYPCPDDSYTIRFNTIKPFVELNSFDALSSTLSLPPVYEEAVIYNLAIRLAPEYGKPIVAEVAQVAKESYDIMINLNADIQRGGEIPRPVNRPPQP